MSPLKVISIKNGWTLLDMGEGYLAFESDNVRGGNIYLEGNTVVDYDGLTYMPMAVKDMLVELGYKLEL